jgi:hypothetical protein
MMASADTVRLNIRIATADVGHDVPASQLDRCDRPAQSGTPEALHIWAFCNARSISTLLLAKSIAYSTQKTRIRLDFGSVIDGSGGISAGCG